MDRSEFLKLLGVSPFVGKSIFEGFQNKENEIQSDTNQRTKQPSPNECGRVTFYNKNKTLLSRMTVNSIEYQNLSDIMWVDSVENVGFVEPVSSVMKFAITFIGRCSNFSEMKKELEMMSNDPLQVYFTHKTTCFEIHNAYLRSTAYQHPSRFGASSDNEGLHEIEIEATQEYIHETLND